MRRSTLAATRLRIGPRGHDPAGRTAFLNRKVELFTRIADQAAASLVARLAAGGRLTLEWATVVELDTGAGPEALPLARRTGRHLAEGAALEAVYAAGG